MRMSFCKECIEAGIGHPAGGSIQCQLIARVREIQDEKHLSQEDILAKIGKQVEFAEQRGCKNIQIALGTLTPETQ
jgi:hypothetical protein